MLQVYGDEREKGISNERELGKLYVHTEGKEAGAGAAASGTGTSNAAHRVLLDETICNFNIDALRKQAADYDAEHGDPAGSANLAAKSANKRKAPKWKKKNKASHSEL